jgi:predicted RNA-binding protein associated with RNAse of E/G family
MSENPEVEDERPCLHCLIGDLIDEYYGEYGSPSGEADVIDVDEIMTALAKVVAEITSGSDAAEGRRIVDDLTREIGKFDAEYRESATTGGSGVHVRH